jgi:hypothetical protein
MRSMERMPSGMRQRLEALVAEARDDVAMSRMLLLWMLHLWHDNTVAALRECDVLDNNGYRHAAVAVYGVAVGIATIRTTIVRVSKRCWWRYCTTSTAWCRCVRIPTSSTCCA